MRANLEKFLPEVLGCPPVKKVDKIVVHRWTLNVSDGNKISNFIGCKIENQCSQESDDQSRTNRHPKFGVKHHEHSFKVRVRLTKANYE